MRLRFAPSPTGWLHLGNARVALANWMRARQGGGAFLLRLDDTDAERVRPEFAEGIEEDLRWLGLDWDGRLRQSERAPLYEAAAEALRAKGLLYPCLETEEELAYKREQRRRQGRPPVYDRAALSMTPEQLGRARANGKSPHWRFRLSGRTLSWRDGVLGERSVKLPSLSDPVLVRADGGHLYTFTSVVDDLDTGITEVVRGEDHVTNTGVQLDLIEALTGRPAAIAFAHLPLLTDEAGAPLSKRRGDVSLRQLRRDGVEAAALTGYLVGLGAQGEPAPGTPAELAPRFGLDRLSRSPARFDPAALLALNRRHLRELPFETVRDRLPAGTDAAFWEAVRGNLDLLSEARGWWEVASGEAGAALPPEEAPLLRAALDALPPEPWDEATWGGWTGALSEATGRRGRAILRPLRLALTGEESGPELRAFLPLIGRDRAAARLRRALV